MKDFEFQTDYDYERTERLEIMLREKVDRFIKELFVNYRLYEIDGIELVEITTITDDVFETLVDNCINKVGLDRDSYEALDSQKFMEVLTEYDTIFLGDNKCLK